MEDEMDEMAGLAERLLRDKTGPVPKMTPQEMLRAINAATGKEPDVVAFVRCGRFGLALHDPKIRAEFTSPGDPDLLVSDALITACGVLAIDYADDPRPDAWRDRLVYVAREFEKAPPSEAKLADSVAWFNDLVASLEA